MSDCSSWYCENRDNGIPLATNPQVLNELRWSFRCPRYLSLCPSITRFENCLNPFLQDSCFLITYFWEPVSSEEKTLVMNVRDSTTCYLQQIPGKFLLLKLLPPLSLSLSYNKVRRTLEADDWDLVFVFDNVKVETAGEENENAANTLPSIPSHRETYFETTLLRLAFILDPNWGITTQPR